MSLENPSNIPPQEIPKQEKEQVFSEEGLLNRNFGKDIEKPSEALFFRDGILNRPKFQEMTQQRKVENAEKLQKLREELGIANNPNDKADDGEKKPFSSEGLLNRNFGKEQDPQSEPTPDQSETVQESSPASPTSESGSKENVDGKEKPIMQQMVEAYQKLSDDPEKAAYDALYNRLEPNLSEEAKNEQMSRMAQEYRLFKEGKEWKQG